MLAVLTLFFVSCQQNDEVITPEQQQEAVQQPQDGVDNAYVDRNWHYDAYLSYSVINSTGHTNFMHGQNAAIARLFGQPRPTLRFVKDNAHPNSTMNAISYRYGRKIYFGEAIYRRALAAGSIWINVYILAHEAGHQYQFRYGWSGNTMYKELEADGFGGFYLRNGARQTWAQASPSFNFAFQLGGGNHGSPAQRRSAVRLGWYLGAYNSLRNPRTFDYNFRYYYNTYVIPGRLKTAVDKAPKGIDPEVDAFITSKLEELIKLYKGELTEKDFTNLSD